MEQECPTFRPSLQDFKNGSLEAFVRKHERKLAASGVLKIVAPEGWLPRRSGYDKLALTVPRPIRQHAMGRGGIYRALLVESKDLTLEEFKRQASAPGSGPPKDATPEQLERAFWRNVTLNPPLYGADVSGSLFDEKQGPAGWNPRRLTSLLSRTLAEQRLSVPGVTSPYLYFGSWRAFFAWHTEDLDLHSVNYLHTGAPKVWYVIPPAHRARFEQLVRGMLPEFFSACPEFLRHKELMLSPALLASHSIPVVRVVHRPGEFVVVLPGAYHAGFNGGFNIAETLNFATEAWLPLGARARFCDCRQDSVRIDMRLFGRYMTRALRAEVEEAWATESDSSSEEEEESDEEESGEGSSDEEGAESEAAASGSEEEEEAEDQPKAARKKGAAAVKARAKAAPRKRSPAAGKTPRTPAAAGAGGKRRAPGSREDSVDSAARENAPANKRPRTSGARPAKPFRPGKVPQPDRPAEGYEPPRGAAHAAWGAPVAEERPVAVVERDAGGAGPRFYLAHRLDRRTAKPGCLWVGLLREDGDGLFRPTGVAREVSLGLHFPKLARVRSEWQEGEGKVKGGWKLITLQKRIVM